MADPVSPAAGRYIDKPFWDAEVYDRFTEIYGLWTPYTPVWTTSGANPTPGTSTLVGRYKLIGKTCLFHVRLTYGTGVTVPANVVWYISMPFPSLLDTVGSGRMNPGGTNSIPLASILQTSGRMYFTRYDGNFVGATAITGWVSGNFLVGAGAYEIA